MSQTHLDPPDYDPLYPNKTTFVVQSGINYVQLSCAKTKNGWKPRIKMKNSTTQGILIVHSESPCAGQALLNGVQMDPTDEFRGILVADGFDKVHGKFIGALIGVGDTSSANAVGNGAGQILYSREIILGLARQYGNPPTTVILRMLTWRELNVP
jgi:hypothetical protein